MELPWVDFGQLDRTGQALPNLLPADVRALHVGEIPSPQIFPDSQIPVADIFA
jgi:hypothetical protein